MCPHLKGQLTATQYYAAHSHEPEPLPGPWEMCVIPDEKWLLRQSACPLFLGPHAPIPSSPDLVYLVEASTETRYSLSLSRVWHAVAATGSPHKDQLPTRPLGHSMALQPSVLCSTPWLSQAGKESKGPSQGMLHSQRPWEDRNWSGCLWDTHQQDSALGPDCPHKLVLLDHHGQHHPAQMLPVVFRGAGQQS